MKTRREIRGEIKTSNRQKNGYIKEKSPRCRDIEELPLKERMRARVCDYRSERISYTRFKHLVKSFVGFEVNLAFARIRKILGDRIYEKHFAHTSKHLKMGSEWWGVRLNQKNELVLVEPKKKVKFDRKKQVYLKNKSEWVQTKEVKKGVFLIDGIHYRANYEQLTPVNSAVYNLSKQKCPVYPSENLLESPTVRRTPYYETFYVNSLRHLTKKELKSLNLKNKV